MPAFKHVLVPVDFSACSDKALELALDIAKTNDAKLTLVHVVYTPPLVYAAYSEGFYWPMGDIEVEEKRALEESLAKAKKHYPNVDSICVTGKPWQKILEVALKSDADLIVMGTSGRTGLAHVLLGSVAEKVVRVSPVPVLTACLEGRSKQVSERPPAPVVAQHV